MNPKEIILEAKTLIDEVKFGILATRDSEGRIWQRWMSPVFLPRIEDSLFCVTSNEFQKVQHIASNPEVSWIFQSSTLDRIASLRGRAKLVRDPMLAAEVQEAIGPRLRIFWKYAMLPQQIAIIQTFIDEYEYFVPMKGIRQTAKIKHDEETNYGT